MQKKLFHMFCIVVFSIVYSSISAGILIIFITVSYMNILAPPLILLNLPPLYKLSMLFNTITFNLLAKYKNIYHHIFHLLSTQKSIDIL